MLLDNNVVLLTIFFSPAISEQSAQGTEGTDSDSAKRSADDLHKVFNLKGKMYLHVPLVHWEVGKRLRNFSPIVSQCICVYEEINLDWFPKQLTQ